MEVVVPVGRGMTTEADIERHRTRVKGPTLRALLNVLAPLHPGIIGLDLTG